jgi:hypothetical protein
LASAWWLGWLGDSGWTGLAMVAQPIRQIAATSAAEVTSK